MKNKIQDPGSIQLVAPEGGVKGGEVFAKGGFVGVVSADAAEGESFTLQVEGAFGDVPKQTGQAWGIGDKLFYDAANKCLTKSVDDGGTPAVVNEFAGLAYDEAASTDVTGVVYLK